MTTKRRQADTLSRALPELTAALVASIVLGIVGMHALNMPCFTMLAATAGAVLLLLLGLRRRPRVWEHRSTVPATVTGWVTARLGTGPPYVWQFSVIRC